MARHAVVLREWVSVDDYLKVSEAVLRIFDAATELRKNIAKARLKFLVHRVGEEEFRRMVDEELEQDWARDRDASPDPLLFLDDEAAEAPPAPTDPAQPTDADRAEFAEWARTAVRAQKQAGYSAIEVKVPEGDLSPEQFRGLAALLREHGSGRARTTPWQNIVLRWIPDGSVYTVWQGLLELGLGDPGTLEIEDVVSCPGTDSCKLGITSSMGLNRALGDRVREMAITDPLTRRILINASGCPNSCGQHHIANIGFHGAAIRSGERQVPRVPRVRRRQPPPRRGPRARHAAQGAAAGQARPRRCRAIRPALRGRARRRRGVQRFFERVGKLHFEDAVRDLTLPPEFSLDTLNEFIDWERDGIYVLERGEGECAV